MANLIRKASNRSVDFIYDGFAGYDDVAEFDYEDHTVLVGSGEELGDTDGGTISEWGFIDKDRNDLMREAIESRVEMALAYRDAFDFDSYEDALVEIEEDFGIQLDRTLFF